VKAAVYARVSTKHQAEKEISIQEQIRLGKEKASELGATEIDVFTDEGYSGADPTRPSLQEILLRVRQGEYQLVVCYDVDRWARDLGDQLVFADQVESSGARLDFVVAQRGEGPEGNLFFQIKGAFAEYERAKIRQRSILGKYAKAKRGQMVTCSRPPYGYRYNGDAMNPALVIHDKEAEIVRQIYTWTLEEDIGSVIIARRLEMMGIPSPGGNKHWQASFITRMLKNEVYCGVFYNLRYRVVHRDHRSYEEMRPREEWVAIQVPPIVSRACWEKAVQRLSERLTRKSMVPVRRHLLQGIFYCGVCGHPMSSTIHNGAAYYRCYGKLKHKTECNMPYFMAEDGKRKKGLDGRVWDGIAEYLRDPAVLESEYKRIAAESRSAIAVDEMRRNAETLERTISRLRRQKDELLDLRLEGLLTANELKRRMQTLSNRLLVAMRQLNDVRGRISVLETSDTLVPSFSQFLHSLSARLNNVTFEDKREILRMLKIRAYAYPDMSIEIRVPVPIACKDSEQQTLELGVRLASSN
jgi:site-specific DNA recombinase